MRLLWLALPVVCTVTLEAQSVRGVLVDSISGAPLNMAFLTLVDEQGVERARAITDGAGQFVLLAPAPGSYRIRSKRIGFRPYVSPALALRSGETTTYNAAVDPIPVPLNEVVVAGERQCDVEAEAAGGASVVTLWEEVREALAAVAWTSRVSGYWYELTHFERELTAGGKRLGPDSTWHQVGYHKVSFRSAPAMQLVLLGYVVVEEDGWTYYAPDADVLLSEPFLKTHCFETKAEKGLVGLGFTPAGGRSLPDIKGTLWVDRENAELRYLEFTYTRLPERVNAPHAGGRLEFMRVPNGAWIVRDWVIRMPLTAVVSGAYESDVPRVVGFRETGGSAVQIKTVGGTVVYRSAAADTLRIPAASEQPKPTAVTAPPTVASVPAVIPDTGRVPANAKPMRDYNQLHREEFEGSMAISAYALVQKFRPNWLHHRGPTSAADPSAGQLKVYVDGFLLGDAHSLHSIPMMEVQSLRRLSGPEATGRYGARHSAGVIEVATRRR